MASKTSIDQTNKETDPIVEKTNQLSKDDQINPTSDQINPTTSDQNDEKDLKLNIEFRNQVINKLNQFNEIIFVASVDEKKKSEIFEENNQLTSILLKLPVLNLVDSVNCASEIVEDSKNVQLANRSEQTQNSDDISAEQFVQQVESLLIKVKKFDPKNENIEFWFEKYRIYSTVFKWSLNEHLKALPFFFHPSVTKIIKSFKIPNEYDYLEQELIKEITYLTNSDNEIILNRHPTVFNRFSFSQMEIKYWLELHRPISTFKITHPSYYDRELKDYELWIERSNIISKKYKMGIDF